MTVQNDILESYYPTDWTNSGQSSQSHLIFSLHHHARQNAGSMEKLFLPSAGALYVYRPSKRRRVLNRAVDKLEGSRLLGCEYVIAHLYDKYRRNLTISTIGQTGQTLGGFLAFLQEAGRLGIEEISRREVAAYVENEQERGLKINSVRNHLQTVYAFIGYLIDKDLLPLELLRKKIRVKLPEVLPRAIPTEDLRQLLAVISPVRDRALRVSYPYRDAGYSRCPRQKHMEWAPRLCTAVHFV
jgi:integrase/recombinase XerD